MCLACKSGLSKQSGTKNFGMGSTSRVDMKMIGIEALG